MEIYGQIDHLIRTMDFPDILRKIGIDEKSGGDGGTSFVIASGVVASACLIVWGTKKLFSRLSSWNLPGPKDSVFLLDIFNRDKRGHQLHLLLHDYVQEYGSLFAFNYKGQPTVVTCDEEMIRKILWKEFPNFRDRKFFEHMPWPCHEMITMAKGDKAKAIRQLLGSVLQADSIKNSWKHFVGAAESVDNILEDAATQSSYVDGASLANGYVMQILAKMAFSLDLVNQSKENDSLVHFSQQFTRPPTWLQTCSDIPILKYLTNHLPGGYNSRIAPFIKVGLDLVKQRRAVENQHQPQDILDVLLTAQSNDKSVTDELLLAQAIVLLTAVHCATSTTITIATYFIAKHKDVQRKLQEEIDSLSTDDNDGTPTFDQLHQDLKYMDQVIHETVRLYPSGFMLMRECTEATTVNNISFEKGDSVLIPTYSIQRDPKIYEDPEHFNPDRFQKNPSKHYYAFGDGYRRCAGKQMAFSEMKMYLFKMLKSYNLSLADVNQQLCVKSYVTVQAMIAVEEPIRLLVQKR